MSDRQRLTRAQVAARYAFSTSTLDRKVKKGVIPAPEKLGGGKARVRWVKAILDQYDAWIDYGLTARAAVLKVQPGNRNGQDGDGT